ncbi:hypothetical protein BYZ73_13325 [Rhodovulum viride]|uniref:Sulfotransferase family protein n=1 Tax=Rhodovulum viride TaxID=1231134 RepID=A0ABX9DEH4_9RHOB|nr:hypothetical protein [Rhodovulum viride]RAP40749.1 hypothetical protein BYZ73_13325 [Rhodovulum viride]
MIRRLILHIGRHKTGTSAVQRYLAAHRASYAAAGIVVPDFGGYDDPEAEPADRAAHHRIALDCGSGPAAPPERRADWHARLAEAAEGGHTLVLSSEAFQNCSDFGALRALCRDHYVEVVCYLREYLDYALSAYAQEVKKVGLYSGFFEFERGFNPQLARFVTRWEEFANRCHWRLYDRTRFAEGDVVQDFLTTADLPDFGGDRFQSENPRLGGSLLGFKLMANGAGLHSLPLARALDPLATSRPAFRAPWRIGPERQADLRARRDYNATLEALVGEVGLTDLSAGALPFESPGFAADLGQILGALDSLPRVRAHPIFAAFQEQASCPTGA